MELKPFQMDLSSTPVSLKVEHVPGKACVRLKVYRFMGQKILDITMAPICAEHAAALLTEAHQEASKRAGRRAVAHAKKVRKMAKELEAKRLAENARRRQARAAHKARQMSSTLSGNGKAKLVPVPVPRKKMHPEEE